MSRIDLIINNKIKLLRDIQDYLDKLVNEKHKYFEIEKSNNGIYWVGIDFEVEMRNITISYIGFQFIIDEVYESAFLMPPAPIEDIVEKFIIERMYEEIKVMQHGPEEGDEVIDI